MALVSHQPEVTLAQRLASNEKPVRSKALKALRKYINLRSQKSKGGLTSDDLLKIWKGLFYSLWMQDKPLLQEELSNKISGLIHSFHTTNSQLLYLQTFLQTLKREWNGLDRLRMDKFFQLVRFMFKQVFEVLKRREWDSSVVNQFLEVFTRQLLQTACQVPNGLVLHILDLYMTELACVGAAELTAEQNLKFIEPFCKTLSRTKDRLLLTSICNNIFRTIVDQAPYAIEDLMKELQKERAEYFDAGHGSEDDVNELNGKEPKRDKGKLCGVFQTDGSNKGSDRDLDLCDSDLVGDDEICPVLQFDYGMIADQLFELASSSKTPSLNRTKMYSLVKLYRNLSEGIFPQGEDEVGNDLSESSDDELFKKMTKRKIDLKKTVEETATKKLKVCEDEQKPRVSDHRGTFRDARENHKKKKKQNHAQHKQTIEHASVMDREQLIETSRNLQEVCRPATECNVEYERMHEEDNSEHHQDLNSQMETSDCGGVKTGVATDKLGKTVGRAEGTISYNNMKNKQNKKKSTVEDKTGAAHGGQMIDKRGKLYSDKQTRRTSNTVTRSDGKFESPDNKIVHIKSTFKKNKRVTSTLQEVEREMAAGYEHVSENTKPAKIKKMASSKKQPSLKSEVQTVPEVTSTTSIDTESSCASTTQKKKNKKQKKTLAESLMLEYNTEHQRTEGTALKKRVKRNKAVAEFQSSGLQDVACTSETDCIQLVQMNKAKKKRKMQTEETEISHSNGYTKEKMGEKNVEIHTKVSTPVTPRKKQKMKKTLPKSDFISFQDLPKPPTPLFCKTNPKGGSSKHLNGIKTLHSPKPEIKKVTFGLKNNKTTEFKKTDESLLVSPVGPSRVAFDPTKRPATSVLKSPSLSPVESVKKRASKKRATAADFF